ncbi:MAG: hypothetical protein HN337_00435, partial [Deltaproteobacteria bacterium]|nr:hypothetical protein [Deltaproteobacteria bacterium]
TINGARKRLKDWARGDLKEPLTVEVKTVELEESHSKQLEAFPSDSNDEACDEEPKVSGSGIKTLKKIRRDLENLLDLVRE